MTDRATPDLAHAAPTPESQAPPERPAARESSPATSWPEVVASALVGTARSGGHADALLDTAAVLALRRRAGVPLIDGASPPEPAPADPTPPVKADAAARADALLALDGPGRDATPVRDMAGRLELLAEWLAAAAKAGRRLPPELVPALLDAGRRHRELRPWIAPVAGPLAGWLAGQRPEWAFAASVPGPVVEDAGPEVWELGAIGVRTAYLGRLRGRDPAAGRELLERAWDAEPPEGRAALLAALSAGLSGADEPLLERALDDRHKQVRAAALDLLARLPGSGYARRMAERALASLDLRGTGRIGVTPPVACDRAMRRDGIAARPPAGTGERAWWLEEILARTQLGTWPEPRRFLDRGVSQAWTRTVRQGLARAAAAQRDGAWAAALVDPLTADVSAHGRPEDRLLLEALYEALPPDELAARATAALQRGLAGATAVGVDRVLTLCPRPWPAGVAEAVFTALEDQLAHRTAGWRMAGLCELAALRLPADLAPRAATLVEALRELRPNDPGATIVKRFAAVLRFRHDMLRELA